MTINSQQPYSRGYRAFFDGFVLSENPFEYGSDDYNQWHEGYNEAMSDDEFASGDYDDDGIDEFDSLFDNPEDGDDEF